MGRCDDDFILRGGGVSCGGVGYISARYDNVLHVSYSGLFTCIIHVSKDGAPLTYSLLQQLQLQCVSKDLSDVSCGGVGCICAARYVNIVRDIVVSYSGLFTMY